MELHQAPVQGNAYDCQGPDRTEEVDHCVHEMGLRVVQQAGLVKKLHKPGPHQEQPNQDPLCAEPSKMSPRWLFACTYTRFIFKQGQFVPPQVSRGQRKTMKLECLLSIAMASSNEGRLHICPACLHKIAQP